MSVLDECRQNWRTRRDKALKHRIPLWTVNDSRVAFTRRLRDFQNAGGDAWRFLPKYASKGGSVEGKGGDGELHRDVERGQEWGRRGGGLRL